MAISENGVSFFGAGGHNHNGVNSTLIDANSYSIFDFKTGYVGSPTRIAIQQINASALEDWVVRTINSKVLQPAGLDLKSNTLSGKAIRANTITAVQLQANTITADEIAANTITADELVSNIVLVNNSIRSSVYTAGSAGWIISNTGSAEFNNVTVRGTVAANSGNVGGWSISSSYISGGSTSLYSNGTVVFGNTSIFSNGRITNGSFTLSSTGVLTATGANIGGQINANSGTIGAYTISNSIFSNYTPFVVSRYDNYRLILGDDATITARLIYDYDSGGDTHYPAGFTSQVLINKGSASSGASIIINSSSGANAVITPGIVDVNTLIKGPMIPTLSTSGTTAIAVNAGGYIGPHTSNKRFKYDIQDYDELGLIDILKPKKFKWKEPTDYEETEYEKNIRENQYEIGFIAEEIEEIDNGRFSTYLGRDREKLTYWKVDNIVAMLVAEVQHLRARVQQLENGV